MTQGILPTSSRQVHAYTTSTGQLKKKVPAAANGTAMPHIQTARLYMSKSVSPPAAKMPLMTIVFTVRPII